VCVETFRKRTPFFEKIRKNAEPHRNRNGVHGNFKNNPALSLSPDIAGQSFRKVSSLFQTRPPDYASFPRRQAQAASLDSSAARGQRIHGAGRQAYEHAIVASAGPGETVKRAASHWFG